MRRTHEALISIDAEGNPTTHNPHLIREFFKHHPNSEIYAKFTKRDKSYSNNALRYYWAEVIMKMQQGLKSLGYEFDAETTHDFIKQFFPIMYDEIPVQDKTFRVYKSIKDLSNEEFWEYIESCKRFAAENFSLIINDPTNKKQWKQQ